MDDSKLREIYLERFMANPHPHGNALMRGIFMCYYYRFGQMRRRATNLLTHRWWLCPEVTITPPLRGEPFQTPLSIIKNIDISTHSPEDILARADDLMRGNLCYLGRAITMPGVIDWRLEHSPNVSHLWRFKLHYHEFLLDLALAGHLVEKSYFANRSIPSTNYYQYAWQLVCDWIDHNDYGTGGVKSDAWHPYCISRRIPNWLRLWSVAPATIRPDIITRSLYRQACYLRRHMEWDLRGNHLLENIVALIYAAAAFDSREADRWLIDCHDFLQVQLDEQILPHGEHCERSPMYHVHITNLLLDVAELTEALRPSLARLAKETAHRMACFLDMLLGPDRQLPLLGDSSLGETVSAEFVLRRAEILPSSAPMVENKQKTSPIAPVSTTFGSYWSFQEGNNRLLFDSGPLADDALPAHAHADLLNINVSLFGMPVIIDTGVYEYTPGAMRDYCRSTAAHNTLQIDNTDQMDFYSSFRVGYRGHPGPLVTGHSQDENVHRGQTKDASSSDTNYFKHVCLNHKTEACWAYAQHNAYRCLGVPKVGRLLACMPGGPWICLDVAFGKNTSEHHLTQRLHLHPDAHATLLGENEVAIEVGNHQARLRFLTPGDISIIPGWFCPRFGERIARDVIVWQSRLASPSSPEISLGRWSGACGWSLDWGGKLQGADVTCVKAANNKDMVWQLAWQKNNSNHTIELSDFAGHPLGKYPAERNNFPKGYPNIVYTHKTNESLN